MAEKGKKGDTNNSSHNNSEGSITTGGPGIITGQEIEDLGLVESIDDQFRRNCLKAASCDLTFGSDVFICGEGNPHSINLEKKGEKGVTIKSFGRIIFSTREKVKLPKNIVGRFGLRISSGLDGLVLQIGPQIEPGYEGPLFGALLNTRGDPKTIDIGDRFLTVEFSRISGSPKKELFKPKEIKDLDDFLNNQGIKGDELAKPSIIQNVKRDLTDCQVKHGVQIQREDSKMFRSAVKWGRFGAVIAIGAIILTGVATIFKDEIHSWFCNGQTQKQSEHVVRSFADEVGNKTPAIIMRAERESLTKDEAHSRVETDFDKTTQNNETDPNNISKDKP